MNASPQPPVSTTDATANRALIRIERQIASLKVIAIVVACLLGAVAVMGLAWEVRYQYAMSKIEEAGERIERMMRD